MLTQHRNYIVKPNKLFYRPRSQHHRHRRPSPKAAPTFQKLFVVRALRLFGCSRCHEHDPNCLSFYLRNDSNKVRAVRVRHCKTVEEVKQELRLGEVLCRNCHKVMTSRHREKYSWLQAYKIRKGCLHCKTRNPSVLELHHVEKKKFNISRQKLSVPTKVLRHELDKTIVLCANCHSKHHS